MTSSPLPFPSSALLNDVAPVVILAYELDADELRVVCLMQDGRLDVYPSVNVKAVPTTFSASGLGTGDLLAVAKAAVPLGDRRR